jgi:hypothetical protein
MLRRQMTNRAVGLLGLTVLALGAVTGPATAQYWMATPLDNGASKPLRASFTTLWCRDESYDNAWPIPNHDEPYLLIFAADLQGTVPTGKAFITQIFSDVDEGERRDQRVQFWPLAGGASPIRSENDYIFLAALMESDDVLNAGKIRRELPGVLVPRLQLYKQSGLSRAAMVNFLRGDMSNVIDAHRDDYGDADDRIGGVFEVLWNAGALKQVHSGQPAALTPSVSGGSSLYDLNFVLE